MRRILDSLAVSAQEARRQAEERSGLLHRTDVPRRVVAQLPPESPLRIRLKSHGMPVDLFMREGLGYGAGTINRGGW